jgi:hypothetical protein
VNGRAAVRPLQRPGRIVAGVAVALVAACSGGSGGPDVANVASSSASAVSSSGGPASNDSVAYSRCIRSHGVPEFPDPNGSNSSGGIPKGTAQQFGVSSSQLQAAQRACQYALPTGSFQQAANLCMMNGECPQALVQRILTAERTYAQCMRSHGVPNWPDPTTDSAGRPVFDVTRAGIDRQFIHSSLFRSPNRACQHVTGGAPMARE